MALVKVAPIRSETDYQRALRQASRLITATDKDSLDNLEVYQALIERWELRQTEIALPTPIEAIKFRMQQSGLKPRDLEPYLGSRARVSEILSGKRALSLEMIRALHWHLKIPAESLIGSSPAEPRPTSRSPNKILSKLKDLDVLRRGEDLASFTARALGHSLAPAMLRKTRTDRTNTKTDMGALEAWCGAVLLKSGEIDVRRPKKWPSASDGRSLAQLSREENGPSLARETLKQMGIAFVVLEHFPGTYLDGAAMLRSDGTPVIAVTLRYDRIDNFWFTLLHEYLHVCQHLGEQTELILDDLEVKVDSVIEREADDFAQDALIPATIWRSRTSPTLSINQVEAIAFEAGVHPAVVAGRWQREHGDYRRFAKLLGRGEVRPALPRA
jgi:HTH-type transcriptional regulator / antitoxin HigA